MNDTSHFHTISRTAAGDLAIYRVAHGRKFVDTVRTNIRFFRGRRLRKRIAATFQRDRVEFLVIEGDLRFDFDLCSAIFAAGNAVGTKVRA